MTRLTKKSLDEMEAMAQLLRALQCAIHAHSGQVDKNGRPYIGHVLRVMGRCETLDQMIVAALHDVVEDTALTLADLRSWGFADEVILAVDLLTRQKPDVYATYIASLDDATGDVGETVRAVKIADLRDHLDSDPLMPRPADYELLKPRYEQALARLLPTS